MSEALASRLPTGIAVPDELEQAWAWMEEQGWGVEREEGDLLTPYAGDRQLGIVFDAGASLDGWFDDGTAGRDRLVPIAELAGDGGIGALWRDDTDAIRFVGLGSDGDTFLLADSAVDFLRLVAIGYGEITAYHLGLPPEAADSVDAVEDFRTWVEETFGVDVPEEWPAVGDDEFSDWVAVQLGWPVEPAPGDRPDPPDSPGAAAVTGDVRTLLGVLGETDGPEALAAVAGVAGVTPADGVTDLRWSAGPLRTAGLEVAVTRGVVTTVFAPGSLVDGLDSTSTRDDVLALLGEPERSGPGGLRYVVGGRYLHVSVGDGTLGRLTLMLDAP